jgi:hypothetical protein
MQIHMNLNMSVSLIKFTTCKAYEQTPEAIGVKCLKLTRLLTLVQVGDCWKYALDAIVSCIIHISLFIIKFLCFILELYLVLNMRFGEKPNYMSGIIIKMSS